MSIKSKVVLMAFTVLAVGVQPAQAGVCRDPWVTQAIQEVSGRAPSGDQESGECNIYNFNGGSWGSYPELKRYVRGYFARNTATYVQAVPAASAPAVNTAYNQQQIANSARPSSLIGNAGGTLIGHDGAT